MLNREVALIVDNLRPLCVDTPQHRHAIYQNLTRLGFLNYYAKFLPSALRCKLRNQFFEEVTHACAHVTDSEFGGELADRECTAHSRDHPLHVFLSFRSQIFRID